LTIRVALAGCGAWGENLLRVLAASPRAEVAAVADPDRARLARARALSPRAALVAALDEALDAGVDAVVIATPPASHAELSLRALEAGADVFVEKPLALGVAEAERCAARAAALGRVAMVGHLLRYHPAVERLLALAREGALGELSSFGATRVSMSSARGRERGARAALWTLGPHDLSVLGALDPSGLREAVARAQPGGERLVLEARLESGLGARIELCRASPVKERRLRVAGASRIAVLDDVRAPDRIVLAARRERGGTPSIEQEIRVPWREPLAAEVDHFLRCVEERAEPLTPFDEGAAVVRVLARADATLEAAEAQAVGAGAV
jgi:predicted dehydrogenase